MLRKEADTVTIIKIKINRKFGKSFHFIFAAKKKKKRSKLYISLSLDALLTRIKISPSKKSGWVN